MKYILFVSLALLSCANPSPMPEPQETAVAVLEAEKYTVEFFTPSPSFTTGYNAILARVKDKQGAALDLPAFSIRTTMHMQHMKHGSPVSAFKRTGPGTYEGFIIFQMPENASEKWEIVLNDTDTLPVAVQPSQKVRTQSFLGSDGLRYVLAMQAPENPKVGSNVLSAYLYRMQDAFTFLPADGYTLALDPRMPGMGNHSSPNNRDLVSKGDGRYEGTVNLTMSGYWKLNLILKKDSVIKGEAEDSTLYFELEF